MADLQRLDARVGDVLGLQPRHHAAAVLLQAARLVELGAAARAHEPAVAAQVGRILDERCFERVMQRLSDRLSWPAMRPSSAGRPMPSPCAASSSAQRRATPRPSRTPARSRGEPRANASRETARAISGADLRRRARSPRSASSSIRNPTASSRSSIWAGSRKGLASRAASSRAPAPVTVRSIAASRLPCLSPEVDRVELEAGAARRVDQQHGVRAGPFRRPQHRLGGPSASGRRT